MCINGDAKYVVPRLKQEITKGITKDVGVGFSLTAHDIIDAASNDDFHPPVSWYEAFPHFNSYESYATELKGCF